METKGLSRLTVNGFKAWLLRHLHFTRFKPTWTSSSTVCTLKSWNLSSWSFPTDFRLSHLGPNCSTGETLHSKTLLSEHHLLPKKLSHLATHTVPALRYYWDLQVLLHHCPITSCLSFLPKLVSRVHHCRYSLLIHPTLYLLILLIHLPVKIPNLDLHIISAHIWTEELWRRKSTQLQRSASINS